MTDEQLLVLMRAIDPQTQRVPPAIRMLVDGVVASVRAEERERCAQVAEGTWGARMTPLRWLLDLVRGAHPAELVMLAAFVAWLVY